MLAEEGGAPDWETVRLTPTPTASPTTTPSSGTDQEEAFAATQAVLADHHWDEDPREVVEALTEECATWLSAGHSPETLRNALYLVHTGWRRRSKSTASI